MSLLLLLPNLLTLLALSISTWTDIKVREVPNLLSYGLISLGLVFAVYMSWTTKNLNVFSDALIGGMVYFVLGAVLFLVGWWGGGDVKIVTGIAVWHGLHTTLLFLMFSFIFGGLLILGWFMLKVYREKKVPNGFLQSGLPMMPIFLVGYIITLLGGASWIGIL